MTKARSEGPGEPGTPKDAIRQQMWSTIEESGVARFPGARGRIPNFAGAKAAAERLARSPEWAHASIVKANPDAPQLPVRARALEDGKRLYVAVPRLRAEKPFLLLDPAQIARSPRRAVSIRGASEAGRAVSIEEMERIDMVVCGSVAVNREGIRVGKGGGYSDLELGLLADEGLVDDRTVIVTTVHSLQILEKDLPETEHDFRVRLIVTPEEIVRTEARGAPVGILWDHLDEEKIAAIPALASRWKRRDHGSGRR